MGTKQLIGKGREPAAGEGDPTPGVGPATTGTGEIRQRTAPVPAPTKARRRPALTAAGVALIALGGLGGGWVASHGGHAEQVVVLRNALQPGHPIQTGDLTTTQISGAGGVPLIPAADLSSLTGLYPTGQLPAGTLLTRAMTRTASTPSHGHALVGLAFKDGQLPGAGLRAGQNVTLVLTSATSAGTTLPAGLSIGQTWQATIADLPAAGANSQSTVVDFYIDLSQMSSLSTASGVGNLAMLVTPGGQ